MNANPAFLEGFLANTSSLTAEYLARGINANVINHAFGQDLLSVLITNISPAAAAALASGVNQNVAANPADNLLTGLLANTNGQAGIAIATGLNNNPSFVRVLVENVTAPTAIAAANGINLSCQRAQTGTAEHPAEYYQFLRKLLANLGPAVAQASSEGLVNNPELQPLISAMINSLNAAAVAPVIAAGLNGNPAVGNMIPDLLKTLDATTAHTIALALNANPSMTSLLLKELKPAFVAGLLKDNSLFLSGLISNLDGAVIANALNAEYAMHTVSGVEHPENSLLGRLFASPDFNGADLADLLDTAGYDFLVDLLANLDGAPIAQAINNAGQAFLTEFIAYLNPDLILNVIRADRDPVSPTGDGGGGIKDLNIKIYVYELAGLPIPLGDAEFKTLDVGIWIPPDLPPLVANTPP